MTMVCEGIGRRFGAVNAVEDVTFALGAGETLALIGPNGAGKSTTLGMITTAIRPDRGRIEICGLDALRRPGQARREIGVLFQEPALDLSLTPRETLRLHAALYGIGRRAAREAVEASLSWADLARVGGRPVRLLSGGMKRRLELARALLHAPRLLVLDEPTLGLDPQGRRDLWARIDGLRTGGLSVLLVTHVLTEAERCDRVGVMDGGRLLALDTPDGLKRRFAGTASASLEETFLQLTGRTLGDREEGGRQAWSRPRKVAV